MLVSHLKDTKVVAEKNISINLSVRVRTISAQTDTRKIWSVE